MSRMLVARPLGVSISKMSTRAFFFGCGRWHSRDIPCWPDRWGLFRSRPCRAAEPPRRCCHSRRKTAWRWPRSRTPQQRYERSQTSMTYAEPSAFQGSVAAGYVCERLAGTFSGTLTGSLGSGIRSGRGGDDGLTAGLGICSGIVMGSAPGWCAILIGDLLVHFRRRTSRLRDTCLSGTASPAEFHRPPACSAAPNVGLQRRHG